MYSLPLGNHMLQIFLVVLHLTLDYSFKVKLGRVSIKVPISCLLLVLEVCNVQSTFRRSYAANLLVVSYLTLDRSILQGQVMAAWHKSIYILLIVASRGLQC